MRWWRTCRQGEGRALCQARCGVRPCVARDLPTSVRAGRWRGAPTGGRRLGCRAGRYGPGLGRDRDRVRACLLRRSVGAVTPAQHLVVAMRQQGTVSCKGKTRARERPRLSSSRCARTIGIVKACQESLDGLTEFGLRVAADLAPSTGQAHWRPASGSRSWPPVSGPECFPCGFRDR